MPVQPGTPSQTSASTSLPPAVPPRPIAVIGAGVIGAAVAYGLAREGRKVLLIDRAEPGIAGSSYGNVGHIAAELVQPLPSPSLLFGFWRELVAFDGPLDIPARRLASLLPWITRFASSAFRQDENTAHLAPLVRASRTTLDQWLREIHRSELLRSNGHYEIWRSPRARERAQTQAAAMSRLGVPTEPISSDVLKACVRTGATSTSTAAGLWFPESGHVTDPLEIVRAFVRAAVERGTDVLKADVYAIEPEQGGLRVLTSDPQTVRLDPQHRLSARAAPVHASPLQVAAAVICTGAWSRPLLESFRLRVPMESARGYHIEMTGHPPVVDAPVLYSDERVLVTPMSGRVRASSYMEFERPDAAPDPRKPRRLREKVRDLGFDCPSDGPAWVGPRPVLPDYLPGIGRVLNAPDVFYAIGHQHIGLTLAAVTGELVADLVAERPPRHDISAFDLRRFG
jgi:glycine/D-amino acid oxidase-like deaminating enzyme